MESLKAAPGEPNISSLSLGHLRTSGVSEAETRKGSVGVSLVSL